MFLLRQHFLSSYPNSVSDCLLKKFYLHATQMELSPKQTASNMLKHWQYLSQRNVHISYGPAIPLLGVYPMEKHVLIHRRHANEYFRSAICKSSNQETTQIESINTMVSYRSVILTLFHLLAHTN